MFWSLTLLTIAFVLTAIWRESGQWFLTAIVTGIISFVTAAIVTKEGNNMERLIFEF